MTDADREKIAAAKAATPSRLRRRFDDEPRPFLAYGMKDGEVEVVVCGANRAQREALMSIGGTWSKNDNGVAFWANRIAEIDAALYA